MDLSLDFGGSTVDMILSEISQSTSRTQSLGGRDSTVFSRKILKVKSFERSKVSAESLSSFLRTSRCSLKGVSRILVTGGKSRFFSDEHGGVPVIKVPEIEAIGKGGWYLLQEDPSLKKYRGTSSFLVVSLGTGTCMVEVTSTKKKEVLCTHVGGTGVGGGTFLGLSHALLGVKDLGAILKLSQRGDLSHVDVSVRDIIGSGIGKVPSQATASNLARLSNEIVFSNEDLASGIINLIGQTIGSVVTFAARSRSCPLVLLTGKLTKIEKIMDVILETAAIYDVRMVIPDRSAFVSAFGTLGK